MGYARRLDQTKSETTRTCAWAKAIFKAPPGYLGNRRASGSIQRSISRPHRQRFVLIGRFFEYTQRKSSRAGARVLLLGHRAEQCGFANALLSWESLHSIPIGCVVSASEGHVQRRPIRLRWELHSGTTIRAFGRRPQAGVMAGGPEQRRPAVRWHGFRCRW